MDAQTITFIYLASSICFILSLRWMNTVPTARWGVISGILGMLLAVGGTLLSPEIEHYSLIVLAMVVGTVIGVPMAMMPMTAVPQRTALSHAFGALAVTLVGTAEYFNHQPDLSRFTMVALVFEVLLGSLTITASLMAAGKLQELLPGRPMVYKNQNLVNLSVLGLAIICGIMLIFNPGTWAVFPVLVLTAALFGVFLIMPIGGADMPTVIALLNSYAGLAACAMGFVLDNKLLIVAGALDGSSGFILSVIMCRAMNRSFTNVLFGAFGQVQVSAQAGAEQKTYRSSSAEEAAHLLASANSVVIVPGYGMAVAQAQHKVNELYEHLTESGVNVRFAIHPVAGRMPGHMNVLLAEADVPYESLVEMEEINEDFPQVDVALVIGANDVTNPAARNDKTSAIYGMPILNVDYAKTVMVIKRSMNTGFAGIDNELYYMPHTLMLFGDAKAFVGQLVKHLEGA